MYISVVSLTVTHFTDELESNARTNNTALAVRRARKQRARKEKKAHIIKMKPAHDERYMAVDTGRQQMVIEKKASKTTKLQSPQAVAELTKREQANLYERNRLKNNIKKAEDRKKRRAERERERRKTDAGFRQKVNERAAAYRASQTRDAKDKENERKKIAYQKKREEVSAQ